MKQLREHVRKSGTKKLTSDIVAQTAFLRWKPAVGSPWQVRQQKLEFWVVRPAAGAM
jgi:hypothetical protein